MVDENNDESSSSEDEISKDALKEATDNQFFKDIYFSNAKSEAEIKSGEPYKYNDSRKNGNSIKTVSLRKATEEAERFSNFGVSPSFQSYVARKLDEIIEKSIHIKKKQTNNIVNDSAQKDNNCGVKLLNSSTTFLTTEEEADLPLKRQNKRKVSATVEDKTNLLKCKEVAVDPGWILSKTETIFWTNKRGEPEFKYKKLKDGALVETT